MILSDEQVRHLVVSMLTAPTERDEQSVIGASDLSDPCDMCLGAKMLGIERVEPFADRPYLGSVVGTFGHLGLEDRIGVAQDIYPTAEAEQRVTIGQIPGYGVVPGHYDMKPTKNHILDYKWITREKLFPLVDFIAIERGEEPPYGRRHASDRTRDEFFEFDGKQYKKVGRIVNTALSEREYAEKMLDMEYRVQHYYGQQQGYMRGAGPDAQRASLVFIARDGSGYNDNPEYSNYENPASVHDIFILSFDRDDAYMDALLERGQRIWEIVKDGAAGLQDLERHPRCFFCKRHREEEELALIADIPIQLAS